MKKLKPSEILKYYLNDKIIEKLLKGSGREYAVKYGDVFGKRPMIFQYRSDIENIVKQGATSFHVSEERWTNPLALSTDLKREELDEMRSGWDLLIDVDCKALEISKLFTDLLIKELSFEGVRSMSVKFSGGSGFHILVPYESFPSTVNGIEVRKLFPDAPMILSRFLKERVRGKIKTILEKDYGARKISQMFSVDEKDLYSEGVFDPYKVIEIDTILISERHLFRMQYSLNEKKWLASVPIDKNKVLDFREEDAEPFSIDTSLDFFDVKPMKEEASRFFQDAYDMFSTPEEPKKTEEKTFKAYHLDIIEDKLPPCIKIINKGLSDGRKRSVFILTNFYRSIGKNREEVKAILLAWNQRNKPPLKENYIQQQVEYIFSNKPYPPPNCDAAGYYKYFNVCFPDETCKTIKNPLSYYLKKAGMRKNRTKVDETQTIDYE